MKTTLVIIGVIAVIALVGVAIGYNLKSDNNLGYVTTGSTDDSIFAINAGDLVGTKTGTSTVGVGFSITSTGGQSATSTYIKELGSAYDSAIITLKALKASTTANLHLSILGSNDDYCTTATTTTSFNSVTTNQINWFDLGDHLRNKVHSTSIAIGTSTMVWDNPATSTGRQLILDGLNTECLALQVSGSSTELWAQLRLK